MQVRDGMSPMVLTVGPGHTLRDAARLMSERHVGAAVVIDPDAGGPGILTERDVLTSVGAGESPDVELVADHLTRDVVFAEPSWSLEEAAAHGARRLSPPDRRRAWRDSGDPLRARRRALLDRRGSHLPRSGERSRGVREGKAVRPQGMRAPPFVGAARGWASTARGASPTSGSAEPEAFETSWADQEARQWESSGSSSISRRVSMIQRITHTIVRIEPPTTRIRLIVMPTTRECDPGGRQQRQDRRAGEVDLLARGRDLGVERAHEM